MVVWLGGLGGLGVWSFSTCYNENPRDSSSGTAWISEQDQLVSLTTLGSQQVFLYKDSFCVQHPLTAFWRGAAGKRTNKKVCLQTSIPSFANTKSQFPTPPANKQKKITISPTLQTTNPYHHISPTWYWDMLLINTIRVHTISYL